MVDINNFDAENVRLIAIIAQKRKADQEKTEIINEILLAAKAGLFSVDLKVENPENRQWLCEKDFNITPSMFSNCLNVNWAQNTVDNSINNPYA